MARRDWLARSIEAQQDGRDLARDPRSRALWTAVLWAGLGLLAFGVALAFGVRVSGMAQQPHAAADFLRVILSAGWGGIAWLTALMLLGWWLAGRTPPGAVLTLPLAAGAAALVLGTLVPPLLRHSDALVMYVGEEAHQIARADAIAGAHRPAPDAQLSFVLRSLDDGSGPTRETVIGTVRIVPRAGMGDDLERRRAALLEDTVRLVPTERLELAGVRIWKNGPRDGGAEQMLLWRAGAHGLDTLIQRYDGWARVIAIRDAYCIELFFDEADAALEGWADYLDRALRQREQYAAAARRDGMLRGPLAALRLALA